MHVLVARVELFQLALLSSLVSSSCHRVAATLLGRSLSAMPHALVHHSAVHMLSRQCTSCRARWSVSVTELSFELVRRHEWPHAAPDGPS